MHKLTTLLTLLSSTLALSLAAWPDLPFTVSGRDILSASGSKVIYAGVNWPGAADAMLPEGLQYNSIENIVGFVKDLGMNVVRLTYAIEMIDDIFDDSPNQSLEATLKNALGEANATVVLGQVLERNPQFTAETTRLEVFDAVAAELANQQIYVHLDNHVSKAQWCCGSDDGNAWFGGEHSHPTNTYFDVSNWTRGLAFMAEHAAQWPSFASTSLRNELREPTSNTTEPYTWTTWLTNTLPAASAIHSANPAPLIFFSGLGYDTDDTFFVERQTFDNATFTPETYPFREQIVYELHNYANDATACGDIAGSLYNNGYCAMDLENETCPNKGPVVLTEFGFNQGGGADSVYAQCIRETITGQPGGPGGWMQWVLAGSYYIREGIQDYEETWGLLNHDWSGWRNETVIEGYVRPFVQASLA